MSEETIYDQINESIRRGERAKLLWEMFLDEIQYTVTIGNSNSLKEIMDKFKENQEAYFDAVNNIRAMTEIMMKDKNDTQKE